MGERDFFSQTSWTTVIRARAGDDDVRLAALQRLLTKYQRPILLEMRSRGRGLPGEAEDLAQQFLHDCLKRDFLRQIDPARGRFRAFIKECIGNFLRDQHGRMTAQKRGGGVAPLSLDELDDEGRPRIEPASGGEGLELILDQAWASQVLELAVSTLEQECVAARRGALFRALKPHLQGDLGEGGYAEVGQALGMREGAVRTAMSRLRRRLGELLEDEIRETIGDDADWREELRYFLELLGRGARVT